MIKVNGNYYAECKVAGCCEMMHIRNPNNPRTVRTVCPPCETKFCDALGISTKHGNTNFATFAGKMLTRAKSRGKHKVNLTVEDIVSIWPTSNRCPILGVKFEKAESVHDKRDVSPSLDRIDSSIGYEIGNVQIISNKANKMKQDATTAELKTFSRWMLDNL